MQGQVKGLADTTVPHIQPKSVVPTAFCGGQITLDAIPMHHFDKCGELGF